MALTFMFLYSVYGTILHVLLWSIHSVALPSHIHTPTTDFPSWISLSTYLSGLWSCTTVACCGDTEWRSFAISNYSFTSIDCNNYLSNIYFNWIQYHCILEISCDIGIVCSCLLVHVWYHRCGVLLVSTNQHILIETHAFMLTERKKLSRHR